MHPMSGCPKSLPPAHKAATTSAVRTRDACLVSWHQKYVPNSLQTQQRRRVISAADKDKEGGGFGDELLDFMYAGKKQRKWYGQEGLVLPKDEKVCGQNDNGSELGDSAAKDAILVVDADTVPMAEQVLLQLILARAKLKALVNDAAAASTGYGPYVEIIGGSAADAALVRRMLNGVRALVLCGKVTSALLNSAVAAGVPHLVLLSAVGAPQPGGFALFGNREVSMLADASREADVLHCEIPHTIVRIGSLTDAPGGISELRLGGSGSGGPVGREDAALVLAEATCRDPSSGSVVCAVSAAGAGVPPKDWAAVFEGLMAKAVS